MTTTNPYVRSLELIEVLARDLYREIAKQTNARSPEAIATAGEVLAHMATAAEMYRTQLEASEQTRLN